MEEKKLDLNSILGFVLIGVILLWVLYNNQPTEEEIKAEKAKKELVEKQKQAEVDEAIPQQKNEAITDSASLAKYKSQVGAFGYGAALASNSDEKTTTLENSVLRLVISNKGGQIVEAQLKNYKTYDSIPLYLVKDGNANFNINFNTSDNRNLNTKDLFFTPTLSKEGNNQVLSMRLKTSDNNYLEYKYIIKPDEYFVDFTIHSQGLNGAISNSNPVTLHWNLDGIRHSHSIKYEDRYTRLTYLDGAGDVHKLGQGDDDEKEENVKWLSYRQHFFTSILVANQPFKSAEITSKRLYKDESPEEKYTKQYTAAVPLTLQGGELNYNLHWYFGPTYAKELNKYSEYDLTDTIPFGWGIFGIINRYIFTPLFGFLSGFLPFGIAIIVMTILVRLLMSPVTYKSYLSQAKMKVLRPELNEINEKYKDNSMKKQQETMKLQNKAGVSPMSGCVPALLQMPIFYALFMFFPTAFVLRQKSFLWANDLSSYDVIAKLPFNIPLYGDHVSLFPILASIAIFFYMRMTTGQNMQMQQQPGMPNMKFIMYLSPLAMLIFFNSYASGLSLYYFVSNLITIFIMLAIKKFIIDEDKIHAKIQENKKKPKKQNRFQRKMQEMMEQAEQQKNRK
ncbi:membrane protein insertase YidC [Zhouia sp. PK063]|uniref:membrane protein insertase YidC n=1 Tax=Zhouia sp. PK063 TaxID=3373602 RepID=UPI00378C4DAE